MARRTAAAEGRGPSWNGRAAARQAQGLYKASAARAMHAWYIHTCEEPPRFHVFLFLAPFAPRFLITKAVAAFLYRGSGHAGQEQRRSLGSLMFSSALSAASTRSLIQHISLLSEAQRRAAG